MVIDLRRCLNQHQNLMISLQNSFSKVFLELNMAMFLKYALLYGTEFFALI